MKTIAKVAMIMVVVCSCSKSEELPLNSPPFPADNSVGVHFVDEKGNDASDKIEMTLIGTDTSYPSHPIDVYEMVSEEFSYQCYIDGDKVPPTFQINGEGAFHKSVVELEISRAKTDRIKTFWFVLQSFYAIHNDINSDNLYEFEYRFKLPTLFGDKENNLKVSVKAKNLVEKIFEKVSFNGTEIPYTKGSPFIIPIYEAR